MRYSKCFTSFLCVVVFIVFCGRASAEVSITRVFGPETPGGKYKHPAAIEELANGDMLLVYYGGEGEYEGDTAVFGSRLSKGSTKWTPPQKIADKD